MNGTEEENGRGSRFLFVYTNKAKRDVKKKKQKGYDVGNQYAFSACELESQVEKSRS